MLGRRAWKWACGRGGVSACRERGPSSTPISDRERSQLCEKKFLQLQPPVRGASSRRPRKRLPVRAGRLQALSPRPPRRLRAGSSLGPSAGPASASHSGRLGSSPRPRPSTTPDPTPLRDVSSPAISVGCVNTALWEAYKSHQQRTAGLKEKSRSRGAAAAGKHSEVRVETDFLNSPFSTKQFPCCETLISLHTSKLPCSQT